MIELIKLNELENNTGQIPGVNQNPRDLTNEGFDKCIQSIRDFPEMLEVRTLVVFRIIAEEKNQYVVIGGNQRLRALRELGYKEAPCVIVNWPVSKINEFIIKDNVEYGTWDYDLLANQWEAPLLSKWGLELPVKFEVEEVTHGLANDDEVPDLPVKPITKRGDIWLLGEHRLMCGDSTMIDDVEKLFNGAIPNLMVTDPPYGVNYDAQWRAKANSRKKTEREKTSNLKNDDRADWYDAWVLFPGNIAYVWHASAFTDVVMESLRRADFEIKQQIIWNKNVHALSRSNYHWKHEPCWYAVRNGQQSNWLAGRDQMTVWDVPSVIFEKDKTSHPTQKSVGIYEIPILNHTLPNDSLYDPFGGSGTQIIACTKHNRISYTMELDPKFCDVIIQRWQKFTGLSAIMESTKQYFKEM